MNRLSPVRYIAEENRRFPNVWRRLDRHRQQLDPKDIPPWCYLPVDQVVYVLTPYIQHMSPEEQGLHICRLSLIAAWRYGKGVYRFDDQLFLALNNTSATATMPTDTLYRLPEWCVYIEFPEVYYNHDGDVKCYGVFVAISHWLEHARQYMALNHQQIMGNQLTFLLDTDNGLTSGYLHMGAIAIGPHSISKGVDMAMLRTGGKDAEIAAWFETAYKLSALIASLTLYICSEAADYDASNRPTFPKPKRSRKGTRYPICKEPTVWGMGQRMGAALRRANVIAEENAGHEPSSEGRARPRPHIRRAHWHSFWTGPRDGERKRMVKWLPPAGVAISDAEPEDLPAVVRPVKST